MTNPTSLDLDTIEARANATPDGPWALSDDLEGDGYPGHLWVVRTPASGPDEPDEFSAVVSTGNRALGEFITHARTDVEVPRLRAELATANSRLNATARLAGRQETKLRALGASSTVDVAAGETGE